MDQQQKIDYLTCDRDGWRRLYIASDNEAMRLWLYSIISFPFAVFGFCIFIKWIASHLKVMWT